MKLEQKVLLHNKFELTVADAKTGEVKQKAYAYNVILDNYMKARLKLINKGSYSATLRDIYFGQGIGTPAITDTALFNQLGSKNATRLETVYAYPTSHITNQIVLNADEYNGKTITEVGMGLYWSYSGSNTKLATHAMIQDAEGHQIAIAKTDTDVIYITAIFYCTFTSGGYGDNGIYPTAANNQLAKWILEGGYEYTVYSSRFKLNNSDKMSIRGQFSKSYSFSDGTGNFNTLTYELPPITILDSEWNNHVVKNFGLPGYGAFQFPDESVFPDYAVDHLVIGEGDGVKTEFNIGCPLIKEGTVKVYINGTEIPSSEFTADCESNCGDWYENYHSAGLYCMLDNVEFGNIKECTPYSSARYDPMAWWNCYNTTFYPSSCTVSSAKPIWIDFQSPKECNRLKIDIITVPAAQINNLVIEHSDDNETWTRITATRSEQVWSFPLTTARYWRVYIPGYNWSYTIGTTTKTRDGLAYRTSFFLGKTVPGLVFRNPPAEGDTIDVSYKLNVPFKTQNNILRMTCTVQLQRG